MAKTPEEFQEILTQLIQDAKHELDTNDNICIKTQEMYDGLWRALKRTYNAAEFQVQPKPQWQRDQDEMLKNQAASFDNESCDFD